MGKRIFQQRVFNGWNSLDLTALPAGTYFYIFKYRGVGRGGGRFSIEIGSGETIGLLLLGINYTSSYKMVSSIIKRKETEVRFRSFSLWENLNFIL